MEIFKMDTPNGTFNNAIRMTKPIDDGLILQAAQLAFEYNIDFDLDTLRDEIYKTKYDFSNLEKSQLELEQVLQSRFGSNIKMENQHQEYKWVKINTNKIGSIHDRFYIAPNPKNMHKIALGLVEEFTSQNLPVMFKYQLTTSENHCDRIIIYSDKEHNKQVEDAIKSVYDKNHELFTGCERSMAWIYDTSVPGVYTTPEKPGTSYGNAFANVVVDAYKTFCYLYGVSTMSTISIPEQEKEEAYQWMKAIIPSLLFRNSMLEAKDGGRIRINSDKNIKMVYDYDTGKLKQLFRDDNGYHEFLFDSTEDGKEALLRNFYSVSFKKQLGVNTRNLTLQEEEIERYNALYPSEKKSLKH